MKSERTGRVKRKARSRSNHFKPPLSWAFLLAENLSRFQFEGAGCIRNDKLHMISN